MTGLLCVLAGSPAPLTPAGSCRYDSSLGIFMFLSMTHIELGNLVACDIWVNNLVCLSGLLTKKFINLIKHAEDGILDLNKAAETLEVSYLLDDYVI